MKLDRRTFLKGIAAMPVIGATSNLEAKLILPNQEPEDILIVDKIPEKPSPNKRGWFVRLKALELGWSIDIDTLTEVTVNNCVDLGQIEHSNKIFPTLGLREMELSFFLDERYSPVLKDAIGLYWIEAYHEGIVVEAWRGMLINHEVSQDIHSPITVRCKFIESP